MPDQEDKAALAAGKGSREPTIKELLQRIEALEERVKVLEERAAGASLMIKEFESVL